MHHSKRASTLRKLAGWGSGIATASTVAHELGHAKSYARTAGLIPAALKLTPRARSASLLRPAPIFGERNVLTHAKDLYGTEDLAKKAIGQIHPTAYAGGIGEEVNATKFGLQGLRNMALTRPGSRAQLLQMPPLQRHLTLNKAISPYKQELNKALGTYVASYARDVGPLFPNGTPGTRANALRRQFAQNIGDKMREGTQAPPTLRAIPERTLPRLRSGMGTAAAPAPVVTANLTSNGTQGIYYKPEAFREAATKAAAGIREQSLRSYYDNLRARPAAERAEILANEKFNPTVGFTHDPVTGAKLEGSARKEAIQRGILNKLLEREVKGFTGTIDNPTEFWNNARRFGYAVTE